MSPNLTPEQIEKLRSLGIDVVLKEETAPLSKIFKPLEKYETQEESFDIPPFKPDLTKFNPPPKENTLISLPQTIEIPHLLIQKSAKQKNNLNSFLPLLAISGITIFSFSGIILLKNQNSNQSTPVAAANPNPAPVAAQTAATPTPATQAIQSYLLASQQYFTQALQFQKSATENSNDQVINLLNQSILAASDAVKSYPDDYRGYYQRGRIYQSLVDSKPELINQALSDFSTASKLNPESPDITRDLASLFARKGDVDSTLNFLSKTVSLEPTKAQNFYDLAKIQQQTGRIQDALSTYNRLIPLLTDPSQLAQVQAEKTTLEHIIAQNPTLKPSNSGLSTPTPIDPNPSISFPAQTPKLQASIGSGLIIAAPETSPKIEINNITNSNSLSGTASLPANAKDLTLENSNLTATSQVYLTILKGGKNQTLQVLSKSGTTFKVGLDTAIPEEIQFKWWIIN